jgi:hypothetical protein
MLLLHGKDKSSILLSPTFLWLSGGMVYTADLKSAALTGLWVRVPPEPLIKRGINMEGIAYLVVSFAMGFFIGAFFKQEQLKRQALQRMSSALDTAILNKKSSIISKRNNVLRMVPRTSR